MSICYSKHCKGPSYTFTTMEKMLDHILIPKTKICEVTCVETLDDPTYNCSDHIPIVAKFLFQTVRINIPLTIRSTNWSKVSDIHITEYQSKLSNTLQDINVSDVDSMYDDTVNAILDSSKSSFPKGKFNRHAKPYWTEKVKDSHKNQRIARRIWISEGRPRGTQNAAYANYKKAKRIFVNQQKSAIEKIENQFLLDLNKNASCDQKLFWSFVRSRRIKAPLGCTSIKGENGSTQDPQEILNVFKDHFRNVYTPSSQPEYDENFRNLVEEENVKKTAAMKQTESIPII